MSEWRAGSDDERGESDSEPPVVRRRLHKGERPSSAARNSDHEEEEVAPKPKAPPPSVYESVLSFVSVRESRPDSCTADLATQPSSIASATLHPHQMSGLNWIKSRFELGISAMLADEMGLGKTLQAIAFLAYLQESAHQKRPAAADGDAVRVGPFLVLCPLTLIDNWKNELSSFAPNLLVETYCGNKSERESLQDEISAVVRAQPKAQRKDPLLPFHVLLTTYEYAINDVEFLSRFRFRACVIDEAHRAKNASSQLSQTLVHEYNIDWKLCLTGTPVQNNLGEVWSMLWFMQPELFADREQFLSEFDLLSNAPTRASKVAQAALTAEERTRRVSEMTSRLHDVIRPFMLRRMKDECALDIPPKREIILRTRLTRLQKGIYKNLLLKNFELIGAGDAKAQQSRSMINTVMSLRKCATHPYLFPGVEPEPFHEGPHIYTASGKFALLQKLLRVLKRRGRRVLLFSTSVQTLDIVQDFLSYESYTYERLDGSVRGEERYAAIQRFTKTNEEKKEEEEETFVFLLSTRAGGCGLNLTVADCVIFLDADWNPQADLQAMARAHRIGQKKEVLVIRLVASHTVEEIIQKRTMKKLAMTHQVLSGKFNLGRQSEEDATSASEKPSSKSADAEDSIARSANELRDILQYGIEDLFGEGEDEGADEANEMQEAEIEAIVTGKLGAPAKSDNAPMEVEADSQDPAAAAARSTHRISTTALSSIGDSSLASLSSDDVEPSVYVFEGTDFKELQSNSWDRLDDELHTSAAAGSKALQRIMDSARAAGVIDEEEDGYASPSDSRKRKSLVQETDEERTLRLQRNREMAQKRAESARQRREEAEMTRQSELAARWAACQYQSTALQLDEAKFDADGAEFALQENTQLAPDIIESEWAAVDDDAAEEQKDSSHAGRKGKLTFVVGDATCPFIWSKEDGEEGVPAAASSSAAAAVTSVASSAGSAVVFVPVDASGRWGQGGMFRALDNRSSMIGHQYELMGEMEDLHMGDVHIVSLDTDQLRPAHSLNGIPVPPSPLCIALCVVLKRAKNQQYGPPAIHDESLSLALKKLSQFTSSHGRSLHLPRLSGSPDSNSVWYSIERMLQKHVVARGVDVYAYYFQRRRPQYRSPMKTQLSRTNSDFMQRTLSSSSAAATAAASSATPQKLFTSNQTAKKPNRSAFYTAPAAAESQPPVPRHEPIVLDDDGDIDVVASSSSPAPPPSEPQLSSLVQFQDVFTGELIFLHTSSDSATAPPMSASDERLLSRFISAYDGEVASAVTAKVTYIVTGEPRLTSELVTLKKRASQRVRVMQIGWVEHSVGVGRLDNALKWQVTDEATRAT